MSDKQENSGTAFLALIPAQLLFGSLPVIGKIVLAVLPPIALVGIRTSITAAILIRASNRRVSPLLVTGRLMDMSAFASRMGRVPI